MDTTDFIDHKLSYLMDKLSCERNKKVYIAGDFNFDLLKVASHTATANFYDKLTSNLIIPTISLPTKINNKNNTLIDNIFTNQFNPDMISGNLTVNISDHLPSFLICPRANQNHLPKKHNIHVRDFKNFNQEDFVHEVSEINWENNDANLSFDQFLSKITQIMDKHFPIKRLTNKEHKRKYKPWITSGILTSISRKNKLYKKYSKTKDEHRKKQIFEEYKIIRNLVNELTRKSKKSYYQAYFTEHKDNIQKVWQGIKEISNLKSKSFNSPSCIELDNKCTTDPVEICNGFNNYFANIADDILKRRKYDGNGHFTDYLENPTANSFAYEPCDVAEILFEISQLVVTKASGPNGIPTKILKMIGNEISPPLCKIINTCITSGNHPELLKMVNVVPIFKKGSRLIVSNYRPISLLSNLNKIFEKIIFKRVSSFVEKNDILFSHQFGFRSKHSTTHALVSITEKIKSALDNDKVACGIFVDLQKAFDTVNHEILLKKLSHYGFRGFINDWFRSYLFQRKQKVCLNGFESDIKMILHGVPQGSVLGPFLFLLYINDLHKCIKFSSTYHFADDTNILNISDNYSRLQKEVNYDLKFLNNWLLANKISLNADKTEMIIFHKVRSAVPKLKIILNGKHLTHTPVIKYLGIYLDETLMGSAHCEEIVKKLSRANGIIAKTRHFVPHEHLKNVYYATFSSHLTYAVQVWAQSLPSVKYKIFILQKKAIRLLTFSAFLDHTEPLFKSEKILKVHDNIYLQNCLFVYDYFHGNLPKSFVNTFTKASETHDNLTRHSTNGVVVPPHYKSTTYGLHSMFKLCSDAWNDFSSKQKAIDLAKTKADKDHKPTDLHSLSRSQLKNVISSYILDSYHV